MADKRNQKSEITDSKNIRTKRKRKMSKKKKIVILSIINVVAILLVWVFPFLLSSRRFKSKRLNKRF